MSHQPVIIKKKKVNGHGGHHGGSWKVAYADFVTAMMAFFMVMWIMGLSDETRALVAGYFNDPMGFMKNQPRSKTVIALPGNKAPKPGRDHPDGTQPIDDKQGVRALEQEIKKQFKGVAATSLELKDLVDHIQMRITGEGLRLEFMEDRGAVFFESGSTQIRPVARKLIAAIAPILRESHRDLKIEGHTDAAPYRGAGYDNYDLGAGRANAFRRALAQNGVLDEQIAEVTSFADKRPLIPDDPLHFSNRRVSLLLKFRDAHEIVGGLPKESLREEIQGAFRRPADIVPPEVTLGGRPVQVVTDEH